MINFKELLRSLRQDQTPKPRQKRTEVNIIPGKSVSLEDVDGDLSHPPTSLSNEVKPSTSKVMPKKRKL
jgi:hypothetical protein